MLGFLLFLNNHHERRIYAKGKCVCREEPFYSPTCSNIENKNHLSMEDSSATWPRESITYTVFGAFGGRVVKQEMENIGKDVTEPLSYQETTSKAWEKKPKSYIIFKDLLKSYATQVLFLSPSLKR